jgi:hypothetical protein
VQLHLKLHHENNAPRSIPFYDVLSLTDTVFSRCLHCSDRTKFALNWDFLLLSNFKLYLWNGFFVVCGNLGVGTAVS